MDDHFSFSIEVMGCASSKEVDLIVSCSFSVACCTRWRGSSRTGYCSTPTDEGEYEVDDI